MTGFRMSIGLLVCLVALTGCKKEEPVLASEATQERSIADAGSSLTGKSFEVALEPVGPVKAGEQAEVRVRIAARPGYKINEEYPHAFRPEQGVAGVQFDAKRIPLAGETSEKRPCADSPKDACEAQTEVPFVANEAGSARVSGVVSFSVCNPKVCLIEKVPLATNVEVAPE